MSLKPPGPSDKPFNNTSLSCNSGFFNPFCKQDCSSSALCRASCRRTFPPLSLPPAPPSRNILPLLSEMGPASPPKATKPFTSFSLSHRTPMAAKNQHNSAPFAAMSVPGPDHNHNPTVPGLALAKASFSPSLHLEEGEILSDCSGLFSYPPSSFIISANADNLELSPADIPRFPTYPLKMDSPVPPNRISAGLRAERRPLCGPIPAPGTPQDRFAAMLGRPHDSTQALNTTTPSGNPNGVMNHSFSYQPGPSVPAGPTIQVTNGSPSQTSTQGSHTGKGTGKGPVRPLPGSPVTQWLSYECQRRHFNPDIRVLQQPDGTYRCDIVILNHVIKSSDTFRDGQVAKLHTAAKALAMVQKWPRSSLASVVSTPPDASSTVSNAAGTTLRACATARNAPPVTSQEAVSMKAMATGQTHQGPDHLRRQQELRARLLKNKQSQITEKRSQPREVGSQPPTFGFPCSEVDMANPIEARAFVEGYKMGQAAMRGAQAAADAFSSPRALNRSFIKSRSRSPDHSIKRDRSYRERSPVKTSVQASIKSEQHLSSPRYYDGSRREPYLLSTHQYRPRLDRKDPNFGRLH